MDPKHLFYFSEIVRQGSLSKASDKLGVVQPTLSRIVKILEHQSGGDLLKRTRNGVSATSLGHKLADKGLEIHRQIALAEEEVSSWKTKSNDTINIGVGPMLAQSLFSSFVSDLLIDEILPPMKVTTATAGRLLERLNNQEIDIVLAPSKLNSNQDMLIQEIMLEDEIGIYAGKTSNLIRLNRNITREELGRQSWMVVGARSNIYEEEYEHFSTLGLPNLTPVISFTGDISMCLRLLQTTDMLVALPKLLTNHSKMLSADQELSTNLPALPRNVALWANAKEVNTPKIVQFKKLWRNWLAAAIPTFHRG